ncbi:hypothetical protein JOF56_004358 [Kibdelosporangium banguiense]|uniref:NACHT domain-containing protein n=1 Tax=Kibdelosporangium banguiense TaxID=1365924 RepID=A0ABS4THR3_9PSEU|nr:NACHT domain-containing protein [Kibdelosporangium banguiense]MBP2323973.1 hypothetical protein [Kibdelosporangium banguiense]
MLESLALNVGRQVALHVTRAWLGHRKSVAEQNSSLTDLLATGVTDRFARRRLERQLEDIGDQIAQRITPLTREFPDLPENEREAALDAVVDSLEEADLTDALLLGADMDGAKLARSVRQRITLNPGLNESARVLYNRVLDETCVCLVNVVKNLPAFQPRALTEVLSRLTHIETVLTQLPRTSLDSADEFTGRYLGFISKTLDSLELFGVDTRRYKPQISVTVAYLSLSASSSTDTHSGDLRIEYALSQRTLVRGQAGSGKTTLLQWIAVNAARGAFTGPLDSWNGSVPFLVRLRSYSDGKLPQPEDLVSANAGPIAGGAPDGWAHEQFTSGKALLLVDGVDELRADRRPKVRKWLTELLTAFPHLQVVVTSRPSAAEPAWLTGFQSLELEPMTPSDVTAFCHRWHTAIAETGAFPVTELDEYEVALARNLEARPHLRSLAATPLLCAMLCALNLDRHKQLPPDRMKLYEAALELLLDRRDAERELPVAQDIRLDTKSKIAILQHVAWWLTLNGRSEASAGEVAVQVEFAIRRMPDVTSDAPLILRYLLERSGVLREPVLSRIDFVHKTFQEYLAGKQAAEEHHTGLLAEKAHLDQWRETVVMGAGHATVPVRTTLMNALLDRADKEPRHARRLKLVAATCLDTARSMEPEVIERVDAAIDDLIPPRKSVEARSLALGGERVLRRLPRTLDGLSSAQGVACVQTAALIGGPLALQALAGYAETRDDEIQEQLAEVWQYFPAEQYAVEVLANAPLRDGRITIMQTEHLPYLRCLTRLTATDVSLIFHFNVEDLEFLAGIPCLRRFAATCKTDAVIDLGPVTEHPHLEELLLFFDTGHVTNLGALASLTALTDLAISLPEINNLEFLRLITTIEVLILELSNWSLDAHDLSALATLPKLHTLRILSAPMLLGLPLLPNVRNLILSGTSLSAVAKALAQAPRLESLSIGGCKPDSAPKPTHSTLSKLDVRAESVNLGFFSRLAALTKLELSAGPSTDLSPLPAYPALREVTIVGDGKADLTPLADFPRPLVITVNTEVELLGADTLGDHVTLKRR